MEQSARPIRDAQIYSIETVYANWDLVVFGTLSQTNQSDGRMLSPDYILSIMTNALANKIPKQVLSDLAASSKVIVRGIDSQRFGSLEFMHLLEARLGQVVYLGELEIANNGRVNCKVWFIPEPCVRKSAHVPRLSDVSDISSSSWPLTLPDYSCSSDRHEPFDVRREPSDVRRGPLGDARHEPMEPKVHSQHLWSHYSGETQSPPGLSRRGRQEHFDEKSRYHVPDKQRSGWPSPSSLSNMSNHRVEEDGWPSPNNFQPGHRRVDEHGWPLEFVKSRLDPMPNGDHQVVPMVVRQSLRPDRVQKADRVQKESKGRLLHPLPPSPEEWKKRNSPPCIQENWKNLPQDDWKGEDWKSRCQPFLQSVKISDLESGKDTRTTVMVRNIPNKYTQEMFKDYLDNTLGLRGHYDFLYLRIDFQNHCNVGYSFVNFINTQAILKLIAISVGKKWDHFKSEKVCSLSFATIQGTQALVDRFRNSSVMLEPEKYRPKIFYDIYCHDPNLIGEEAPFPEPLNGYRPKSDVLFSRQTGL